MPFCSSQTNFGSHYSLFFCIWFPQQGFTNAVRSRAKLKKKIGMLNKAMFIGCCRLGLTSVVFANRARLKFCTVQPPTQFLTLLSTNQTSLSNSSAGLLFLLKLLFGQTNRFQMQPWRESMNQMLAYKDGIKVHARHAYYQLFCTFQCPFCLVYEVKFRNLNPP